MHLGIDWGMDGYTVAGGQFRYAVDLLPALARLGAAERVTVFGTRSAPPERIVHLFDPGSTWNWVQKPVSTGRGSDWINQWRSFHAHRRQRLDVLHVIDAPVPAFAPCPVVLTGYDLMMEVFPADYAKWLASRSYRRYRWLCCNRVDRVVAISATTAKDLQRFWRIPEHRIDVVFLGVHGFPPAGFEHSWRTMIATRFPELVGRRFVLAPCNLEPRKNLSAALTAFARVRPEFPDTRLVLFGKGSWTQEREQALNRQVSELGIGAAILRTAFVEDADLAALYRAADVFLFPALYEGFGLPLLEAMACGGCVLARAASAMAEVVGAAGLLVETADPAAIAAGLQRLLGDAAERERLRTAARDRAAGFSPDRMARETAAVYDRALRR